MGPVNHKAALAGVIVGSIGLVAAGCGTAPSSRPPSAAQEAPASPPGARSTAAPNPPSPPVTSSGPASGVSWATFNGDRSRSGLDVGAPPAGRLQRRWSSPRLDGAVYAQPLVVGSEVLVATENDTVYALAAATGAVVWSRHLGTPMPGASLPCGDISPSGITGTPVADVGTGTLWVVTFSEPGRHTLWALDLASGAVKSSTPADPPGSDPLAQQQRAALALAGGRVYVSYGGLFGDCSRYHGWVMGFPTSGKTPTVSFETPTSREGGIWAPPGPAVASDGSLYVATGNGSPAQSVDDSDSVLRLSPQLSVDSRFTPSDFATLSANDQDLGSTSPALLAGGLVFQVGKSGVGYLLDAAKLGGVGGQLASARVCSGAIGGDAVEAGKVFVSCFGSLVAVTVTPRGAASRPALEVAWRAGGIRPGPPVIAGGVVWTVERGGALAGYDESTGALRYRVSLSAAGSFPTLAAVGGNLYVPSGDGVTAFGGA